MAARRFLVSAMAALCAVTVAVALLCASASAMVTHNYLFSLGSLQGSPEIAADSSTGDVYVYDSSEGGSIHKFNAAGEPAEFSATKTSVLNVGVQPSGGEIAVDNSSGPAKGDIYVSANGGGVLIYSQAGESLGALDEKVTSEVLGAPWGNVTGLAVDASGRVYVAVGNTHINKYVPSSNPVVNTDYVASLTIYEGGNGQVIGGIAADSEGSVYAINSDAGGAVTKYDALQFGPFEATGTEIVHKAEAIGVDPVNDDLYAGEEKQVGVYASTGELKETIQPSMEAAYAFRFTRSVAVGGANEDVYVSDLIHGRVVVFGSPVIVPDVVTEAPGLTTTAVTLKGTVNPDGLGASCFFEYGTTTSYGQTVPCSSAPGSGSSSVPVSAEISGLEAGQVYHVRLVATNANGSNAGEDAVFALPFPPTVSEELSLEVGTSVATVRAQITPMGFATTFHVEYGTDTSYGTTVPVPDVEVFGLSEAQVVMQRVDGLQPGTTYHYRVVATNANGSTDGPDKTFTTFSTPPGEKADTCPNAASRVGLSAGLPDCRAYEMVTPVEKNGADVEAPENASIAASVSGDRIVFGARVGMGETQGSGVGGYTDYLASRGSESWSSKGIMPTPSQNSPLQLFFAYTDLLDLSSEFDRAVVKAYDLPGFASTPPRTENFYLENTVDFKVLEAATRWEGVKEEIFNLAWQAIPGGSSSDLGVVAFEFPYNLVPQATGPGSKVYMLDHGAVKLVSILPDGTLPVEAKRVREGSEIASIENNDSVSQDGSRIFFYATPEGSPRQLYMRKNGSSTVLISESESSEPTVAENVRFQAATPDGKKVLFTTTSRLTDSDPGDEPGTSALYLYSDSPNPMTESNLTFIDRYGLPNGANEGEVVKGMSDDGSHIYFTDGGLSLWDSGHVTQAVPSFVPDDEAQVSQDGHRIAFISTRVTSATEGVFKPEMFLYDEDTNALKCVSCVPTGAMNVNGIEIEVKATQPTNPNFRVYQRPRFFSDNGRFVFFNTREGLVSQDTNKIVDAYEYDAATGKVSLLSTGTGERGAWFVDSNADGRDAFLATKEPLSAWDPDKLDDIYDARIDGGLPNPPALGTPCDGDACQGVPAAAPSFNTASEFSGLGNPKLEPAKAKAKPLTRSQRLRQALAACKKKKSRRKRAVCEAAARKRYPARRAGKRANRVGR